jgi:hypothetical protein
MKPKNSSSLRLHLTLAMVAGSAFTSSAANSWVNIGPASIAYTNQYGTNYFSGRVAAVAVDPSNSSHFLLGAALGGVWESTNSGATWSPRTDNQPSLATGAITFAPSNPSIVFVGTGEANFRGDDYAGAGILVSSDGGTHWSLRSGFSAKTSVSSIQVDSTTTNNVSFATTRGGAGVCDAAAGGNAVTGAPQTGVYVSSDSGQTANLVLAGEATDLKANPNNFAQQYAGLGEIYGAPENGVYRTTDGWAHNTQISGPWTLLAGPLNRGRVCITVSPSNPSTVYVGVAGWRTAYTAPLLGIWRSDNAWDVNPTWTPLPLPNGINNNLNNSDAFPRFWYMFQLLVDSTDPNTLYMAADIYYRYKNGVWDDINFKPNNPPGPHIDEHCMAWAGTDNSGDKRMLVGNDGGVWLGTDTGTLPFSWANLNTNLAITEIYKGAVSPNANENLALGGTQDDGNVLWNGQLQWSLMNLVDGGDSAVATANPDTEWVTSSAAPGECDRIESGHGQSVNSGFVNDLPFYQQFYTHFEKSPNNDNVFIRGTDALYRCNDMFSDAKPQWQRNGPYMRDAFNFPVPLSAMAFAPSDGTSSTYAYGTEDGQLRITSNGGVNWNDLDVSNVVPARYISGLAFSPFDANVLYVTLSGFNADTPGHPGHVFLTANALAANPTWTDVSPLVDEPMNCLVIDPHHSNIIFLGSDVGVWRTSDGGTTWTHHGPVLGMPNVPVYDLRMNSGGTPTAFTHGRSAFQYLPNLNESIGIVYQLPYPCFICQPSPCLQCPPMDLSLDPGDVSQVSLPLLNSSPYSAISLTATLLPTAFVTPIIGTQSYGSLAGGASASQTFTFSVSSPTTTSTGTLTFQLQDGTVDMGQVTVPFHFGEPDLPLTEDFEMASVPALPSTWGTTVTGSAAAWSTTTAGAPNDPANQSDDGEDQQPNSVVTISAFMPEMTGTGESTLESPPFAPATGSAEVFFQQAFSVQDTNDGGVLEISINGGVYQDILSAGGSFVQNGYDETLMSPNPLSGRSGWSGDSGGWMPVVVNLPSTAAGQSTRLRWRVGTSAGLTNGFWFVDSVEVAEWQVLPAVTNPNILNPATTGNNFTFDIATAASRTYYIDTTSSLNPPAWQYVQSVLGNGSVMHISVPLPTTGTGISQTFYRFRVK